ncbi:MAG: M14 family zinc carboxypeptidase [Phycisphaerales bacterium]
MRHRGLSYLSAAGAAVVSLSALAGAPAEHPADRIDVQAERPNVVRYDGQMVVRVFPTSNRQLHAVMMLADSVWSERVGIGPIEIQITPDKLDVLRGMGLDVDILIDDVQKLVDAEWAQIQQADLAAQQAPAHDVRTGTYDPAWYETYHQLADIHQRMNDLAAARPDLASVADIGDGLQDIGGGVHRDILAIRVTAPDEPGNLRDDRPVIIWQACQHAREWISPPVAMYFADQLIEGYGTDPRITNLMDRIDFRIIPVCNPDGYSYTWTNQRLWRKNLRGGYGVDLNRNWAYQWGGDGSSGSTSSETYRGTAAFSEPETQALSAYAASFGSRLASAIDYHSYSQLVLWPFGYAIGASDPEPDRTIFDNLATDMSAEMLSTHGQFYDPIQSWELYAAAGVVDDWWYGTLGIWGMTIELRDTGTYGFELPAEQILATCEENWPAALLFAERTALPASISTPSGLPDVVLADTPTNVQVLIADGMETVNPSTATLYARVGSSGPFTPSALSSLGNSMYQGVLPEAPCGDTIEYYFSVQTTNGSTITFPPGGATAPLVATATEMTFTFDDDMETNSGWTVGAAGDTATTGVWERAAPQATAAQPGSDHSNPGTMCWITGATAGSSVGAYDIDGGATTLTGPTMDGASEAGDAYLTFWYWYNNTAGAAPGEDSMPVSISNDDGATWTQLELFTDSTGDWTYREYLISDYVTPTAQMRVRFVASDLGSGSIVEAGVDDVALVFRGCSGTPCPADLDGSGSLNLDDVNLFANAFAAGDLLADVDGNGVLNLDDVNTFALSFVAGCP